MSPRPQVAAPVLARPAVALGLLTLVYLLNFLDRTLIYILFAPIKAEMKFSDLELALLGSTSFVLFYTTLGIPFGWLADRMSRRKLIAAGLVTWSVFSGLTGFAWDFWSLFACRVGVGIGEATLGPAAMSLLSELYPAHKRGTVQSVYSAGVPLGAAAAFFLGGAIGEAWGWRAAFPLLGFPGLLLAVAVLRLPEATRAGAATQQEAVPWRRLLGNRVLQLHVLGYAFVAIAANSLSIWVPTLLVRARGMELATVGSLAGLALAIAGGLGTAFGGWAADRWQARHPHGRRLFGVALAVGAIPAWLLILSVPTPWAATVGYFLLAGLGLAWLGPAAADVHEIVGPRLRGLGTAGYFLVVNLLGYGLAPALLGGASDRLGSAQRPEALADVLYAAPACLCVGAVLLLAANRAARTASAAATLPMGGAAAR